MKTNRVVITALVAASTFIAGCAAPGYPQASSPYPASGPAGQQGQGYYGSYGVVDSIQVVNTQSGPGGIGAGAVVGGLVGGLLGNQVGGGTGRGLATAAGVVGGAVVGNQVEQRNRQGGTAYQVGVRLDNGGYQTYTQESIGDLNIGNRVRIDNGRVYRY
jgi:outer membrane lipoprotein SlyB